MGKAASIAAAVSRGEMGNEVGVAEPQITESLRVKAWLCPEESMLENSEPCNVTFSFTGLI